MDAECVHQSECGISTAVLGPEALLSALGFMALTDVSFRG